MIVVIHVMRSVFDDFFLLVDRAIRDILLMAENLCMPYQTVGLLTKG